MGESRLEHQGFPSSKPNEACTPTPARPALGLPRHVRTTAGGGEGGSRAKFPKFGLSDHTEMPLPHNAIPSQAAKSFVVPVPPGKEANVEFHKAAHSPSQFYGKNNKTTTQTVARPPRLDSRKQTLEWGKIGSDPVSCILPTRSTPWYPASRKRKIKRRNEATARCPPKKENYCRLSTQLQSKKDPAITQKVVLEARLALPFASVGPP